MKKVIIVSGIIIAALFVFILVTLIINPWSHIACTEHYFDINSGKIKIENYFLYIKTKEQICDTKFSLLYKNFYPEAKEPKWHATNTTSPMINYGPHYAFHGAAAWAALLIHYFENKKDIYENRKKEVVKGFIDALNSENSDNKAYEYVKKVMEETSSPDVK
ncbi:MAG: hypothetical protein HY811_10745 [Planctomycetes bacterium]|nr:hypothetical protein [Planctomycetota bacterium]